MHHAGVQDIDVAEWREFARYSGSSHGNGLSAASELSEWFWEVRFRLLKTVLAGWYALCKHMLSQSYICQLTDLYVLMRQIVESLDQDQRALLLKFATGIVSNKAFSKTFFSRKFTTPTLYYY